jgi:predicted cupin superfamily sugar epimerase
LVKKDFLSKNEKKENDIGNERGEIDDLYHFLEQSENYYVSLLAGIPDKGSDYPAKPSLYNETQIGQYTAQEDLHIAADEEREMLCIVSNCWHILKINNSQVMMVGIAFAMPFEIQQFELLHVCMHIDVTPDSNK